MITSIQNPRVKLANALLGRARTRRKEGRIVLEGERLVRDAWLNRSLPEFVFYTAHLNSTLPEDLAAAGCDVVLVDEAVMRHVTDTQTPQGIVGVFPMPDITLPPEADRLLILDAISDPGNVGTLIRTAAGAGCGGVVLLPGCVDPYNPKALRAGMGAQFRLPVVEMDTISLAGLGLVAVYLATGEATTSYDAVDWQVRWGLVVGSEAHGAGDAVRSIATQQIIIPMARHTESLNAAAAAAVILFEAARQRRA